MNLAVHTTAEPSNECPHCGTIKPLHFLVCRPCWREVPFTLWRELQSAEAKEHLHVKRNTLSPYRSLEACAAAVHAAQQAILAHLKTHSSAIL